MENKIESSISNLPLNMMYNVLSYISTQEISRLTSTQKEFTPLMKDKILWGIIYEKIGFSDAANDLRLNSHLDLNQFNKIRISWFRFKQELDQLSDEKFIDRIKVKSLPFLKDIATHGYINLFESILKRDEKRQLNLELTGEILARASHQNCNRIIKIMIERGHFRGVSKGFLGEALIKASDKGHIQVVQTLIENKRFADISTGALGEALIKASVKSHVQVVQTLIKSRYFADIPRYALKKTLAESSAKGHIQVVQALIERQLCSKRVVI